MDQTTKNTIAAVCFLIKTSKMMSTTRSLVFARSSVYKMSDPNSPPNSFPFCYPPGYFFQNFHDLYPYRNSTTLMPHATTSSSPPGQRSSSPQSGSSASGTSTLTCEIASTSTEGNMKQDKRQGKTTQDRWTEDQVKYLVDLWEANISRLESQQSRKVWGEIATKIKQAIRPSAPSKSVQEKN